MTPQQVARKLRQLAAELDAETGRVRFLCCVSACEVGVPGIDAGAGMLRLSRNDISDDELPTAMREAYESIGGRVIPAS
jgi:hypothetical protein